MALPNPRDDARPAPGWRRRWPELTLLVLLAIVYAPLASGHLLFHRDVSRFLHPIRWFVHDALARGDWPWWNPHVGLGYSMLADPQAGLFYPVNLLHALGPLPFTMMAVMFLHLFWGGLGMMRVARGFGLRDTSALIAALAWALSGYVASLWTNGARLPSAAWIPWQVAAALALARAVGLASVFRAVGWAALANAAALLAGDFFVAAMGTVLALALAVVLAPGQPKRAGARARVLGTVVAASALGALLAMVAVMPAALAVAGTERGNGFAFEAAAAGSLHPARLVEWLAPEAFARAWYVAPGQAWISGTLDGAPLSLSVYLGGAVLALVVFALRGAARADEPLAMPSRGTAIAVALVGGFLLLLALGRHTPLFAVWRTVLLPLRYMRAPEKYLLAVVPCVALLAGLGADRLVDRDRRAWRSALLVPVAIVVLAGLASALFPAELADAIRRRIGPPLVGAGGVLAAVVLARRYPRASLTLVVLAVAADLGLGSRFTLRFDDGEVLRKPAIAEVMQPSLAPALPFPRLFRGGKVQEFAAATAADGGDRATRETLRENLGLPFGIAALPGYGVAIPPGLVELVARGRLDVLRLLAVDFALLSTPAGRAPAAEWLTPAAEVASGVRLFHVDRALPRVYLARRASALSAAGLAEHLLDADVVTGATVLLDETAARLVPHPTAEPAAAAPAPCTLDGFRLHELVATCTTSAPAIAVFVEQYADGWRATVDGAAAPLLRANLVMRAVPLPAGRHVVRMAFSPPGLRAGLLLSGIGLGLVLGCFILGRRRAVAA